MIIVKEITNPTDKKDITLKIMHSLPLWFSPPEDIEKKSVLHQEYPFFAVYYDTLSLLIGFAALKIHNEYTAEIYAIGILEQYHGKGAGALLMSCVEDYCVDNKFLYLTVKTLDSSADYKPYDKTRNFYYKAGFIPLEVFTTFWDEDNPCLFLAKYIGG